MATDTNGTRPKAAQLMSPAPASVTEAATTRDGSWADYGLPEPLPPRPAN